MSAPHLLDPFALYLMTAAMNSVAKMMGHRMPEVFIVTIASKLTKVLVRVTCVTMECVAIGPAHYGDLGQLPAVAMHPEV
jgi:hypothetical protein